MSVAEKIRYLREVEGSLRGLGRPMTQLELVRGIRKEIGKTISQSYISQIENGSRPHMTQSTRTMLARFFKVRSEEHTSELQSLAYLVCRLLLEKKKKQDEAHIE